MTFRSAVRRSCGGTAWGCPGSQTKSRLWKKTDVQEEEQWETRETLAQPHRCQPPCC